jgi:hypothetical protein
MTDHPVTYHEAAGVSWPQVLMQWQELSQRDAVARALVSLQERGDYDPQRHAPREDNPPLTVAEHLKLIALGEVAARHFRHPAMVHHAVAAGATWEQVAAATGSDAQHARERYLRWARSQRELREQYPDGTLGLSEDEYRAAVEAANHE